MAQLAQEFSLALPPPCLGLAMASPRQTQVRGKDNGSLCCSSVFFYNSAPAVHQRLGVYQQLGVHPFASREIRQVMPHAEEKTKIESDGRGSLSEGPICDPGAENDSHHSYLQHLETGRIHVARGRIFHVLVNFFLSRHGSSLLAGDELLTCTVCVPSLARRRRRQVREMKTRGGKLGDCNVARPWRSWLKNCHLLYRALPRACHGSAWTNINAR